MGDSQVLLESSFMTDLLANKLVVTPESRKMISQPRYEVKDRSSFIDWLEPVDSCDAPGNFIFVSQFQKASVYFTLNSPKLIYYASTPCQLLVFRFFA